MNTLSKITARTALGVGVGTVLIFFSGRLPGKHLRPSGDGVLIASEPLAQAADGICLWPTDWQVDELRARRATAQRVELQGRRGRATAAPGGELIGGDPLRTVRDPYAAFAAVAVDVARNEVIATDENLFQILAFTRIDNTPESSRTTPIRTIAGENTQIEFQSGVYVDPDSGDIYATNTVSSQVDLNNPNNTFRRGVVGNDVPWSYRMSGVYELPRQIWLSGTWQFYQGFPDTTTVSVGNNTVALTQGTQTLTVEERGTTRLPSVSSLDVSLRKTFRIGGSKSVEPRIDFYNLTNNAAILGRITQLGPTYLRVSNIQRGRLIKLGMSVEF